ncbi:MAG: DUF1508 domain-containing protein [bacterium]|nr:DUF1508 domain-containing protein [bacterium]
MNDKWEIYKDAENQWRWRRTSPNGNIIGASSQAYKKELFQNTKYRLSNKIGLIHLRSIFNN